jgi:hypothetical protein
MREGTETPTQQANTAFRDREVASNAAELQAVFHG